MADKLHIKQQSYSRYELATGEPSLAILREIAILFNVSTDYLVGLSDISSKHVFFIYCSDNIIQIIVFFGLLSRLRFFL